MSNQNLPVGNINQDRRTLLLSSLAASLNLVVGSNTVSAASNKQEFKKVGGKSMYAYVGSRTTKDRNARGEGITVFKVSPLNGALEKVQVVGDLVNPSYLTLSKDGTRLYTVHGDLSEISAFSIDKMTGQLTFLNQQSTQGKNPVHLAIDRSGKYMVVTNHIGSSLAVLPISSDGSLLPLTQLTTLSGPIGPHRVEQKQAKPHFNQFSPSGNFVVVPDKGLDRIFSYKFADGKLVPADKPYVESREGAGPRHMVFHPSKPFAYVVNELDSTVTTYEYSDKDGSMKPIHITTTLPSSFTGNSRSAGIMIDHQGLYLYTSNRGHDSITIFGIDQKTGIPNLKEVTLTGGKTPRFFTLSKDENYLYALNEDSDSIVVLKRDSKTGLLTKTDQSAQVGSPVCMVFSS